MFIKCQYDFPDLRVILEARDALFRIQCYGPFVLWFPDSYWANYNLDCDYIPTGLSKDQELTFKSMYTLRRRILQVEMIESIKHARNMPDHRCVMIGGDSKSSRASCGILCNPKAVAS